MRIEGTCFLEGTGVSSDLMRLRWREAFSEPFDGHALMACNDPDIDLEALLWTGALVHLKDEDSGQERYFHGIIEEAEYAGTTDHRCTARRGK